MNHTIELMVIEDFDEVTALWRGTPGVGLSKSDERPGVEYFLKRNPNLSLVARDKQRRIVGAVMCGHDGRRSCLYHLAVAADCRGQGIGRKLVSVCLKNLREAGVERCNIFVYADNEAGKAFWRHLGWKERHDLLMMQGETNSM